MTTRDLVWKDGELAFCAEVIRCKGLAPVLGERIRPYLLTQALSALRCGRVDLAIRLQRAAVQITWGNWTQAYNTVWGSK
jgi:hypothetical protein